MASEKQIKVLLLAPSHYTPLENIAVSTFEAVSTPFGDLKVCREECQNLINHSDCFKALDQKFDSAEHALEMQLFQIKHVLPNAQIIPLLVGHMGHAARKEASSVLRSLFFDLIVVSSDFSHYGANYGYDPFGNASDVDQRLRSMDMRAFEAISSGDSNCFSVYLKETENTVCGKEPIKLALDILSEEKGNWEMVAYDRSSISLSFEESSVGYMAAAFTN